ncbi:MAG: hypothetical protein ACFE0Q_18355 [Anaerolineae bacterium]
MNKMISDVQWQNYLNEVTDAILTGDDVEIVRSRYGIVYKEDRDLIDLIETLDQSFRPVAPSSQFTNRLKDDLLEIERPSLFGKIRRLPARVQWTAIVTAVIGGILIVLQRIAGTENRLRGEKRRGFPGEG